MATSMHEHQVTNLVDNEAIAILRGIQHYLNQRISNLLVESDCQVVSELLQLATPNLTIGNFLLDIRDIISWLSLYNVQFSFRIENVIVHMLAKNVRFVYKIVVWYGDMSDFIFQAI